MLLSLVVLLAFKYITAVVQGWPAGCGAVEPGGACWHLDLSMLLYRAGPAGCGPVEPGGAVGIY